MYSTSKSAMQIFLNSPRMTRCTAGHTAAKPQNHGSRNSIGTFLFRWRTLGKETFAGRTYSPVFAVWRG